MTRLFVDNREIDRPPDVFSLNQILQHVESSHIPPNCAVKRIQIDGMLLLPESFEDVEIQSKINQVETLNKIEIFTGALGEIVSDSVHEALEYLDHIEKEIPALADHFRDRPEPIYFENLRQLCEGFLWLNLLIDRITTSFQINLGNASVQGVSIAEQRQKFVAVLKQLISSQEKRDAILMSGVLEYEILPFIPVWRETLHIISERIHTAQ